MRIRFRGYGRLHLLYAGGILLMTHFIVFQRFLHGLMVVWCEEFCTLLKREQNQDSAFLFTMAARILCATVASASSWFSHKLTAFK